MKATKTCLAMAILLVGLAPMTQAVPDAKVEVCDDEDTPTYYYRHCTVTEYGDGVCIGYEYYYHKTSGYESETCDNYVGP